MACTGCLTLEPVPIYNHGLSDFAKEFYWVIFVEKRKKNYINKILFHAKRNALNRNLVI